jgi:hypothetical protein
MYSVESAIVVCFNKVIIRDREGSQSPLCARI